MSVVGFWSSSVYGATGSQLWSLLRLQLYTKRVQTYPFLDINLVIVLVPNKKYFRTLLLTKSYSYILSPFPLSHVQNWKRPPNLNDRLIGLTTFVETLTAHLHRENKYRGWRPCICNNENYLLSEKSTFCTICPGSSGPFYIVTYFIKWVSTSWTHRNLVGLISTRLKCFKAVSKNLPTVILSLQLTT